MKNNIIYIIALIFLSGQVMSQDSGDVLIQNGTVITITDGVKEDTDVLIRNGKISQIGDRLTAGDNVRVIDAEGMFVMPGLSLIHI